MLFIIISCCVVASCKRLLLCQSQVTCFRRPAGKFQRGFRITIEWEVRDHHCTGSFMRRHFKASGLRIHRSCGHDSIEALQLCFFLWPGWIPSLMFFLSFSFSVPYDVPLIQRLRRSSGRKGSSFIMQMQFWLLASCFLLSFTSINHSFEY